MKIMSQRSSLDHIRLLLVIVLFLPIPVRAELSISEIMYDLEGSDADREWVEVYNAGNDDIDVSLYRFFNRDGGHILKSYGNGGVVLKAQAYGVIADDPLTFLHDYSNYSGPLFDSSFSLVSSDTLGIKDAKGVVVSQISYSDALGAKGDGNSLQLVAGVLRPARPTPGEINTTTQAPQTTTPANENATPAVTASPPSTTPWKVEPQVYANAGSDRVVAVGSEVLFQGLALGSKKEPLVAARYVWNFGDGEVQEGKNTAHVYREIGEYVVTLDVASGEYSQGDRVFVSVIPADISISKTTRGAEGFIAVRNDSASDLNVSSFRIAVGTSTFTFPPNTILRSHAIVKFSNSVTGLRPTDTQLAELQYPNGLIVSSRKIESFEEKNIQPTAGVVIKDVVETVRKPVLASASSYVPEDSVRETSSEKTGGHVLPYLIAATALIGLTSALILTTRRKQSDELSAEDFRIIEDEDT